jgi:uncharacterized protein YndB with AHSA1/START domain
MTETFPTKTLTISIQCPPEQVYAFVSNPERLPHWATGLCKAVRRVDEDWIVETTDGEMTVRFVAPNEYGVADHVVTLPTGETVNVPLRVIANGTGSEVLFTLFQQPGMSDEQFEKDAGMVRRDLETLKGLLEG